MPRTNMQGAPGPEQGRPGKKKKSSLSTILVVLLVLAMAGGGGYLAARLHMSREQAAISPSRPSHMDPVPQPSSRTAACSGNR